MWSRLGSEVTCIEFLEHVGGLGIDMEIAKGFQRSLQKQGMKFKLKTKVTEAARQGDRIVVTVEDMKKNKVEQVRRRWSVVTSRSLQ